MIHWKAALVGLGALCLTQTAEAATWRIDWTGAVNFIDGTGVAPIGTAVRGFYVFDDAALGTLVPGGGTGYALLDAELTFLASGGDIVVSDGTGLKRVTVVNNLSGNDFADFVVNRDLVPTAQWSLTLGDPSQSIFTGENLSELIAFAQAGDLSALTLATAVYTERDQGGTIIGDTLIQAQTLSATQLGVVPLPATLPALATGLAGLALWRRRRA